MQQVVFGAGLIGCYLGACLSQHYRVGLVCREKVRNKLQDGIQLTDYQQHSLQSAQLSFYTQQQVPDESTEVIWLTVKCTAVEQACIDMKPFVSKHTLILCVQNGLGCDQLVSAYFPDNPVARVMVPFNVIEKGTGHFHRGSQGALTIETTPSNQLRVNGLIETLNSPILPVTASADMTALLWAKLQLNLGNSVNALANIPVKAMLEQRPYRLIIAAMMRELLLVSKRLNIALPKVTNLPGKWIPFVLSLPDVVFKRLANKMLEIDPHVRTSMWWDISLGKKTEIDYLNGAIVEQGNELAVPCPINLKIINLVKQLELEGQADEPVDGQKLYQKVFNEYG